MTRPIAAPVPTDPGYYWVKIVVHGAPERVNWEMLHVYGEGRSDIPEWDSDYQTVVEVRPKIEQPEDQSA